MATKKLTHADIRPVKQRIEDELLAKPGVVGVDINEKVSDGKPTGELAIVVYVEKKKSRSQLSAGEAIPAKIDGIPTDVKEEKIELYSAKVALTDVVPLIDATKYATLHGGISMGPCRSVHLDPPDVPASGNYIFVGTLGAIVTDRTTKAAMALTNFHVACVDSGWAVGNTMCQPGRVDAGACPADTFATLTRATLSTHVDGAVVTIQAGKTTDCSIEEIGAVKGQAAAVLNSAVRKRGRTTGLTFGKVNSIDASVTINYGDGLGNHTLKNQIRIEPDTAHSAQFSDHGDSGSVVVDSANKVVGLLFGGSPSATYANPIQFVLDELNVDLCVKPTIILTKPVICDVIITKPVVCLIKTTTISCHLVTTPAICQVLTTPAVCLIQTRVCPVLTQACPPVSLACGPGGPGGPGPVGPDPRGRDRRQGPREVVRHARHRCNGRGLLARLLRGPRCPRQGRGAGGRMSRAAHGAQLARLLRRLVNEGVVSAGAARDGRVAVTDLSRSNPVGLVHVDGCPELVAKCGTVSVDGIDPIGGEIAAYRWLSRSPDTAHLAPIPLLEAGRETAVVTRAVPGATTLHEALGSAPAGEPLIAELGRILGVLHGAPVAPGDLVARRPWILGVPAGHMPAITVGNEPAVRLTEEIARCGPVAAAIARLDRAWSARTVIHGDVKFDNVLVAADRMVLVDWELAGLGAPVWDLAGVVDGLLLPWCVSGRRVSIDATSVARLAEPALAAHRTAAGAALSPSPELLAIAVVARLAQTATQLAAMGHDRPDAAEAAPLVLAAAAELASGLVTDLELVAECMP